MQRVEEKKTATDNLINEMKMYQPDAQVQDDAAKVEAHTANEESYKAMVIKKEAKKKKNKII